MIRNIWKKSCIGFFNKIFVCFLEFRNSRNQQLMQFFFFLWPYNNLLASYFHFFRRWCWREKISFCLIWFSNKVVFQERFYIVAHFFFRLQDFFPGAQQLSTTWYFSWNFTVNNKFQCSDNYRFTTLYCWRSGRQSGWPIKRAAADNTNQLHRHTCLHNMVSEVRRLQSVNRE